MNVAASSSDIVLAENQEVSAALDSKMICINTRQASCVNIVVAWSKVVDVTIEFESMTMFPLAPATCPSEISRSGSMLLGIHIIFFVPFVYV